MTMINALMNKYALSRRGAIDYLKAIAANTVVNLVKMLPVWLLFLLVSDYVNGNTDHNYLLYGLGCTAVLVLMYITNYIQYNCNYLSTYRESATRRISLAERMRKLPLSYFGKKDLSDLTTTIMKDCATIETSFSHYYPELYASLISTTIVAVGIFFYDWRMALASVWVLPIAIIIVAFSGRVQNVFNKKKLLADLDCTEGIQECLETARDLKSCNAENKYLDALDKKIDYAEKRHIISEYMVAVFVVSAQLLLKFGIATTALVGGILLGKGEIAVMTFFMYLLVVSRIYDPMSNSLQNLAAVISCGINIGRMKEIYQTPVQTGKRFFSPKGYDVRFDNVAFSYNEGEQVLKDVSFVA